MSGEDSVESEYLRAEVVNVYPVITSGGGSAYVMLLEAAEWRGKVLPIFIGVSEGLAIQSALMGIKYDRPMTHDLLVSMLEVLGVSIEKVTIDALLENSVYTATVFLTREVGGRLERIQVDARPSDSVAIALRTGAPIYVAKHLEANARKPEELGLGYEEPELGK